MTSPSIRFRLPSSWYFHFPPSFEPQVLPASTEGRNFACPFSINPDFYVAALDVKVPLTIATIYAVTVIAINQYNRSTNYKPWGISKTRLFTTAVVVHNVGLAVFSALTCWGMLRALAHTWPSEHEVHLFGKTWPGLRTTNTFAGAADALCHMHGPRGFGDAVYYNAESHNWSSKNLAIKLRGAEPDPTDVGRLWNEGLAFWGFWFYLSKFYEVVDTFIIVAKGKRSSTLQTYHHAGAMMCMWAGIRFMSPPIWMFVFINSGIHAMMYTYYALSAVGRKVPQSFKRALTTMQIMQFIIGMSFAALHLFVEYTIPVTMPYQIYHTVTSAVSEATSSVASAASEASQAIATAGIAAMLKKFALRAAGEEGLAENVRDKSGHVFGVEAPIVQHLREQINEETKYRTEYHTLSCIETQGEAFAIYLNLLYLLPLTLLFLRFFARSYLGIGKAQPQSTKKQRITKSITDAAKGVEREFESVGKTAEQGVGNINEAAKVNANAGNVSSPSPKGKNRKNKRNQNVSPSIERLANNFKETAEEAIERAKETVKQSGLRRQVSQEHENLRRKFEEGSVGTKNTGRDTEGPGIVQKAKDGAATVAEKAKEAVAKGEEIIRETAEEGVSITDDLKLKAEKSKEDAESLLQDKKSNNNTKQNSTSSSSTSTTEPNSRPSSRQSASTTQKTSQQRTSSPTKASRIPRKSKSPAKRDQPPTPTLRSAGSFSSNGTSSFPRPSTPSTTTTNVHALRTPPHSPKFEEDKRLKDLSSSSSSPSKANSQATKSSTPAAAAAPEEASSEESQQQTQGDDTNTNTQNQQSTATPVSPAKIAQGQAPSYAAAAVEEPPAPLGGSWGEVPVPIEGSVVDMKQETASGTKG